MAYSQLPTRTTANINASVDVNTLQTNIEALKGGTGSAAPVTTIAALDTGKMSQPAGLSIFISGALTASTTVPKAIFRLPKAITLNASVPVKISVLTAPTGAALIVDVHYVAYVSASTEPLPTTIFTTGPGTNRPSIAATEFSDDSGASDVTSLAAGGFVAIYVDQIGSTIAGSDLIVTLITA